MDLKKFEICDEDQKKPYRIQNIALTSVGKNKIEIDCDVIIDQSEGAVISVSM